MDEKTMQKRTLILKELSHTMPDESERWALANNILQASMGMSLSSDDVYDMITPQQNGHEGINNQVERFRSAHIIRMICNDWSFG